MKKIIFAILATAAIAFTSCDKEANDTYCWEFVITTNYSPEDFSEPITMTQQHCDLTEELAENLRRGLETTITTDGVTQTITATKRKLMEE